MHTAIHKNIFLAYSVHMLHIALIVLRDSDGKFLLQFRDSGAPTNKMRVTLFGGSIDPGEDALTAVVREAKEELELDLATHDVRLVAAKPWFQEELKEEETMNVFECLKPVSWDDIRVREGAGAVFLTKEEILSLDIATLFLKKVMEDHY